MRYLTSFKIFPRGRFLESSSGDEGCNELIYGAQGGGIKGKRGGRAQINSCLESRQTELQFEESLFKTCVDLPSEADRATRCNQNIDLFDDAVLASATDTLSKR